MKTNGLAAAPDLSSSALRGIVTPEVATRLHSPRDAAGIASEDAERDDRRVPIDLQAIRPLVRASLEGWVGGEPATRAMEPVLAQVLDEDPAKGQIDLPPRLLRRLFVEETGRLIAEATMILADRPSAERAARTRAYQAACRALVRTL